MGTASTGILIFLYQAPITKFPKQLTVATATSAAKFVATNTNIEKGHDLRLTLRIFGNPVEYCTYMYGRHQSVITALAPRHHVTTSHYVRKSVENSTIRILHIRGKHHPVDCLTKFLDHQAWYRLLHPILILIGDREKIAPTIQTPKKTTPSEQSET